MIHVKNLTLWNTADLRRLYAAALKAAGATGKTARLVVKGPKRGHLDAKHWSKGVRGHCYFGSHARPGTCTMFLPDAGHAEKIGETHESFVLRVARVMHHEALHAVGARHKDMTYEQRYCKQPVPWAEGFELHWVPWSYGWEPKEKPVVNLVEVRVRCLLSFVVADPSAGQQTSPSNATKNAGRARREDAEARANTSQEGEDPREEVGREESSLWYVSHLQCRGTDSKHREQTTTTTDFGQRRGRENARGRALESKNMKHSWLRESVDRVLAEAPHMSDAHKKKLAETVGLELARAWARGRSGPNRTVEIRPTLTMLPTPELWDSLDSYVKSRYKKGTD